MKILAVMAAVRIAGGINGIWKRVSTLNVLWFSGYQFKDRDQIMLFATLIE